MPNSSEQAIKLDEDTQRRAGICCREGCWEFVTTAAVSSSSAAVDVANATCTLSKKKLKLLKKASKTGKVKGVVRFGTCEELLFCRDVGYDSIPSRGSYAMGLGSLESRSVMPVDDYMRSQQVLLRNRAQLKSAEQHDLQVVHNNHHQRGHNHHGHDPSTNIHTPHSARQPLAFTLGSETILETRQCDYKAGYRNSLFEPLSEEERLVLLGPVLSAAKSNHKVMASGCTQSQAIADLNKELQSIRASRDLTGCSCKALKLDKLSVVKMKNELRRAGTEGDEVIETLSKADLIDKVRVVLQQCELCTENNCECVVLGVSCSAEVCGCMKHGKRCANPEGQQIFVPKRVSEYRRQLLASVSVN